jgi:hypothetical protein
MENSLFLINALKDYVGDQNISVSIENEDSETPDFKLIKLQTSNLAKYYVELFLIFKKVFNNYSHAKPIINKHLILSAPIIDLINNNFSSEYCKNRNEERLIHYVKNNYYGIIDFCDIFLEVFDIE